jgi:Spy/CpxP family protein refolding chaperone
MSMKISAIILLAGLVLPAATLAQENSPPAPPDDATARVRTMSRVRVGPQDLGLISGLGTWWKDSGTAKAVGLTDAQAGQIEQAFLEHRLKLIDLQADVDKQETQMQALLDADQADESQLTSRLDQLLSARTQLEREVSMMSLRIRGLLSADQWKKLRSIALKNDRVFYKRTMPPPGAMMFERERELPPLPPAPPTE